MLEAMVADQKQEVGEIDLLSPEERKLLLETWNATEAEYPEDMCIHELFEEQVRRTPKATALVYEEQTLSYEELNQQANQLGHYLIGLGVKPDERVGICVERGVGMVVGAVGDIEGGRSVCAAGSGVSLPTAEGDSGRCRAEDRAQRCCWTRGDRRR